MRLFELLLITITVLYLILGFRKERKRTSLYLVTSLFFILLFHGLIEGIRWQLYPLYFIILIIIVTYLLNFRFKVKWLRISSLSFAILGILISAVTAFMVPIFELPRINSAIDVGTTTLEFEDASRNRNIPIKLWYPASSSSNINDIYCKNPAKKLDGLMGMPGFLFSHLELVTTGSTVDAPILDSTDKYPLVIYSHGAASHPIDNTALMQELASNEYIALSIDHNFSFEAYNLNQSDALSLDIETQQHFISQLVSQVVPNQAKDIAFVLDQLHHSNHSLLSSIDFSKIALIGHSLGGTTALDASIINPEIDATINIDGPMRAQYPKELHAPLLYISSYSPDLTDKELANKGLPDPEFYRTIKQFELDNVYHFLDENADQCSHVRLIHAGHLDFTDFPFILPFLTTTGYDPLYGHQVKSNLIINFINEHLKQRPSRKIENEMLNWLKE